MSNQSQSSPTEKENMMATLNNDLEKFLSPTEEEENEVGCKNPASKYIFPSIIILLAIINLIVVLFIKNNVAVRIITSILTALIVFSVVGRERNINPIDYMKNIFNRGAAELGPNTK